MNPFHLRLLWKGLSGRSVLFSLLFSMAVLGYSGAGFIREFFSLLGIPWWLVWLVPIFLIGALAKREEQWIPNENFRRGLSIGMVVFSMCFGYLLHSMEENAKQYDPPPEKPLRAGQAGRKQ